MIVNLYKSKRDASSNYKHSNKYFADEIRSECKFNLSLKDDIYCQDEKLDKERDQELDQEQEQGQNNALLPLDKPYLGVDSFMQPKA